MAGRLTAFWREEQVTGTEERVAAFPPPSRVYLPQTDPRPATILGFLTARFPQIPAGVWRERFRRGRILSEGGAPLAEDSPYRAGAVVLYWKEVDGEPDPIEEARILYRDDRILVADKPHGMAVTPAGDEVERSLLIRLQRRTGLATLAPAHRLDRDTAGIVLFCIDPAARGAYQRLFAEGCIEREYVAVACIAAPPQATQWRVAGRIAAGVPWYRRCIVDGPVNAVTEIELLEMRCGAGLFRIRPRTGKKHQIRVHMAALGFPLIGDRLYPEVRDEQADAPPLQLLAARLAFTDPLTNEPRNFESQRKLGW